MNLFRRLNLWIVGSIAILDQATKYLIDGRLAEYQSLPVVEGVLSFTRIHNTGVAYGVLDGVEFPGKTALLAVVATSALVGLAVYAASLAEDQRLTRFGLSLVIGGALGNLVDRVRLGYVLDFVDVYQGGWHFWAFNVADAAISVGVAFMILDILLGMRRARVSRAV